MASLSDKDFFLARIRQKLKEDGVKLWEAPYYVDNQTNDSLFQVNVYLFHYMIKNEIYPALFF